MKNLGYLVSAYSVIWVVIAFFVFNLIGKNRRLLQEVQKLEDRIRSLEKNGGSGAP